MIYLIYDKRGFVVSGLNIIDDIDKFKIDKLLRTFVKCKGYTLAGEIDFEEFQDFLKSNWEIKSIIVNFERLNLVI